MSETDYKDLKIGDVDENGQNVLISRVADRPNAFNSYRESKMSSADVKAMFDRQFLHVKKKVNALIEFLAGRDKAVEDRLAAQDTKLAEFEKSTDDKLVAQDEKVNEVYEAYQSGKLKGDAYVITDDDKRDIAQIVLSEFVDGNDVAYTGEGVSEDG